MLNHILDYDLTPTMEGCTTGNTLGNTIQWGTRVRFEDWVGTDWLQLAPIWPGEQLLKHNLSILQHALVLWSELPQTLQSWVCLLTLFWGGLQASWTLLDKVCSSKLKTLSIVHFSSLEGNWSGVTLKPDVEVPPMWVSLPIPSWQDPTATSFCTELWLPQNVCTFLWLSRCSCTSWADHSRGGLVLKIRASSLSGQLRTTLMTALRVKSVAGFTD